LTEMVCGESAFHPFKRGIDFLSEVQVAAFKAGQAVRCPEGAETNQPGAERSGDSRGAPPRVKMFISNLALKGRNNGVNLAMSQSLVKADTAVLCPGL